MRRIWRSEWASYTGTKWRSEEWLGRRGGGEGWLQGGWQGKLPQKGGGSLLGKHTGGSLRWLPCEGTVQGLLQGPLGRWAPGPLTHPVSVFPRPSGGSSWRPEEELPSHPPPPLACARRSAGVMPCQGPRTWLHTHVRDMHPTSRMPVT